MWLASENPYDIFGLKRPVGVQFDIGAVEFSCDMRLHFNCDEGSGTSLYDHGPYVNDGSVSAIGDFPEWSQGKTGTHALTFNGIDEYVKVADDPTLSPNNAISVVAWFKPGELTDDAVGIDKQNAYRLVAWKQGANAVSWQFRIVDENGTPHSIMTSNSYPINTWQHVAGVYDGEVMSIYVNVVEAGTSYWTGYLKKNSYNLMIGLRDGIRYYKGSIDEVVVSMRAYLPHEIHHFAQ